MATQVLTSSSRRTPAVRHTPGRARYADVLRAVAILAVVALHSAAPSIGHLPQVGYATWWTANLIDSACRWCVPIFVMISGALLLDPERQESPAEFYRRRLGRIGIPLVVWSVFYLWWSGLDQGHMLSWHEALTLLLRGTPYYHLYFLFIIAGLYLFTPALRVFTRQAPLPLQTTTAIASLALAWLAQLAGAYLNAGTNTAFGLFLPWVGYYLAGAVLSRSEWAGRWPMIYPSAFVLAIAATAGGAWFLGADHIDLVYSYQSPGVVVMSLCLFATAYNRCRSRRDQERADSIDAVRLVGDAALGIYLIHPALIDLLRVYGINLAYPKFPWAIPVAAAMVFLVSLLVTLVIQRIPLVKRVIG